MEKPERTWGVLTIEPESLLSGDFDSAKNPTVRLRFSWSLITNFRVPDVGEIVLVVAERNARGSIDDERILKPGYGEMYLPRFNLRADKSIGAVSILDRQAPRHCQCVLERIRAFKAPEAR